MLQAESIDGAGGVSRGTARSPIIRLHLGSHADPRRRRREICLLTESLVRPGDKVVAYPSEDGLLLEVRGVQAASSRIVVHRLCRGLDIAHVPVDHVDAGDWTITRSNTEATVRVNDTAASAAPEPPVWLLSRLAKREPSPWYFKSKRAFDVVVASTLLIVLAPLLPIAVVVIKLDSRGPVLYRSQRTGLNGRPFDMFKLRTMTVDADRQRRQIMALADQIAPGHKMARDPRVTRVGRWLRRSSIDELPQLLNVIAGQMSIVGPRPPSMAIYGHSDWQQPRLSVRPGMTGLWQVTQRDSSDWADRTRLDITYVKRLSWRQDLMIMSRTLSAVVSGRGAV